MKTQTARRLLALLLLLTTLLGTVSAFAAKKSQSDVITVLASDYPVEEDGWYSTMEEVAVYLTLYGELPGNYLTKNEAEELGWENRKGNLGEVAPGMSIGGNRFGNYEELLPVVKGRKYTECDIDFDGSYRNGQRIVFSNDGHIYYTDDHYESFREVEVVVEEETQKTGEGKKK